LPPIPTGLFSPSNARTVDGKLIPEDQFFPASRCAGCHKDTHEFWSQSLHRNAGREPFYRESVDILLRTRGVEFTRHCESCHTPVAVFAGLLTKASGKTHPPFSDYDDEGVTCTVCHSIVEARVDGTGSYTIRRPALLAKEDGSPIFGNFTDEQILADVPGHKRAMMRPLLKTPEFCATCHKAASPPDLNGYKNLKGFSAYDEWQQSGASREAALPFYPKEERIDCRKCHMPRIASTNDRAAKDGTIASHRWLGANTAAPLFYGQKEQADLTAEFLASGVLAVDIFAVRRVATDELVAPVSGAGPKLAGIKPGEELIVEVVAANRSVAHSFPPELRDLYEAWIEFEAVDSSGKTIFHSGYIEPSGVLDESAHVYKAILLDELGRVLTRHQVWTANIKVYDNAIPAGRSDLARFRFRLPESAGAGGIKLRARINYRRFIQEYTDYVLRMQNTRMTVPVIRMASNETTLAINPSPEQLAVMAAGFAASPQSKSAVASDPATRAAIDSRRWNDYGIALLEQAQYGAASHAFRQASRLSPKDANLLVNAAIAEFRTERFAPEREQLIKASALLDRAAEIDAANPRLRYWRALVLRGFGKLSPAADLLSALAKEYPRDREVHRQFGQTLYTLGKTTEARIALERVLEIEPQDAVAYQLLAPLYVAEGRHGDAERARAAYLQWRDDPRADPIAARFFAAHPEWADERVHFHTHGENHARRPTLTGPLAGPIK
jgi:Flp pilus assembly protein TadD